MRDIHINNIQIQDLELFLTAAKYGSFTKTGEIMFLSQSWVSKRISFMERELGLQLFPYMDNYACEVRAHLKEKTQKGA